HPSVPDVSNATHLSPYQPKNSTHSLELLPHSAMMLNKAQWALTRRKGVKILFHYAWLQSFERNESIHLYANPQQYPGQLYQLPHFFRSTCCTVDGIIRFTKSNYFYFITDLLLNQESDCKTIYFLIKQIRKLRETEIHHIDHPLVGLLVTITPK